MPVEAELPPGGRAWDETLDLVATDGVRLRGGLWLAEGAQPRGLVLLHSGRTEFLEKSAAPAAELVRRGFAVASLDWRGQGLSQRLVEPQLKGHVGRFTDFHLDLEALVTHPAVAGVRGPRLVVAHSMGGAIALGAIARARLKPHAVILSAPMLGIAAGFWGRLAVGAMLPLARLMGKRDRWPPFAPREPYVFSGFENNVLTGDREMFDWMAAALRQSPALQLGSPTLGWIEAALDETEYLSRQGPLDCPALCLLGSREAVVDAEAVRSGAVRLGAALVEIEGARHEVLIEDAPLRAKAWSAIDRFLEAHA